MIGRGDDDYIAGQLIQLHEQERYDALDLARLVDIASLFADGVELIEEKHAWRGASIFEQSRQTGIGLAKVGAHQGVVAHREKRDGNSFGHSFGERCLAIPRRTRKQDAMARLHALSAKQVGAALFFNQLARKLFGRQREDQAFKGGARL